jgi:hypothetical protein
MRFWLAAAALTLVAVEVVAHMGLRLIDGNWLWNTRQRAPSQAPAGGAGSASPAQWVPSRPDTYFLRGQVIHPYIGYVTDPGALNAPWPTGPLGFFEPYGLADEPGVVQIGVFGGSVANLLVQSEGSNLERLFHDHPAFNGQAVRIRSFAMGGYKQPQQLAALNYLLTLGVRLDLVINLDGFNEVALSAVGDHTAASYPRHWGLRVAEVPDTERLRVVGEMSYLESRLDRLGRRCDQSGLSWSAGCHLVERALRLPLEARLVALRGAVADWQPPGSGTFVTDGPAESASYSDHFGELARIWERSSLQMHAVCEGLGLPYVHLLQPNQYVPESKVFTSGERRRAVREDSHWADAVRAGYPRLVEAGSRLKAAGVSFHDLRFLFRGVQEAVYEDTCCHLSALGNEILARAIADVVVAKLTTASEGRPPGR